MQSNNTCQLNLSNMLTGGSISCRTLRMTIKSGERVVRTSSIFNHH